MTSTLTTYTIPEIRQQILDAFTVYKPADSTAEGSDAWVEANAVAIQLYRQQLRDVDVASWISIKYATGIKLDDLAYQWLLTPRQSATKWYGQITFTATSGSTPSALAGTLTGSSDSGASYGNTEAISAIDWIGGSVTVDAESLTTGVSNNQTNGTSLTLSSTPAGFLSTAVLVVDANTIEAEDQESDEDLRARIFNATKNRPASGNWSHFKEWAEEVDGVDTAFVYPLMYGLGTCLIVPMGPDAAIVTDAVVTAVENKIDEVGKRPVGTIRYVKKATASPVTVLVSVKAEVGYEPDWTGTNLIGPAPAPTLTTFTTTATPNFAEGDRVVVVVNIANPTVEERIVASIVGNNVTVSSPFSYLPLGSGAPFFVRSGGPLWQLIHDAIEDEFKELGPAKCIETTGADSVISPRTPYYNAEHDCTIWSSKLTEAIEAIEGTGGIWTLSLNGSVIYGISAQAIRRATIIYVKTLDPNISITFA